MSHQLIASPYPEGHLVVCPGHDGAIRIGAARYAELRDAHPDMPIPAWLAEAARAGWGIYLAGRPVAGMVLVRPETAYGYARASYELNLGCNYDEGGETPRHSSTEGGETLVTAVAVELLTSPPGATVVPQAGTLPALAPDAVEFVANADTLLTMCSCSASSSQPY